VVPDFASMVNMVLFFVLIAKMSGKPTLGEPSLNPFHPSRELNRLTSVSSQWYPRCLRVLAILTLSFLILLAVGFWSLTRFDIDLMMGLSDYR
jgi:hypothetical protein